MIPLKTKEDLSKLRQAGKILSAIMQKLRAEVKAGVKTCELDEYAQELMRKNKVQSAFKGFRGFPKHICTSVNEEIVHGIPGEYRLKEGDIIGLDVGIDYQGYFSDVAITLPVGKIDVKVKKLIEVTKAALSEGLKHARVNSHLSDISYAVQSYAEAKGFSIVRQFVGHGIGRSLHEEPEIPNFGRPHQGPLLKNGMVLAIEPMINLGTWEAKFLDNGWTAVTKDSLPSAHFEHTIAITEGAPEVLTA